jgi:DNA-binding transcriptional ArsR family regulator
MNEEELARLHKALSVPVRLRILRLITGRPLCVNAITRFLRISQPAVSQHLAVLRQTGLVQGKKSGYMVHYSLVHERLQEFRRAVNGFPDELLSPTRGMAGETSARNTTTPVTAKEEP